MRKSDKSINPGKGNEFKLVRIRLSDQVDSSYDDSLAELNNLTGGLYDMFWEDRLIWDDGKWVKTSDFINQ